LEKGGGFEKCKRISSKIQKKNKCRSKKIREVGFGREKGF